MVEQGSDSFDGLHIRDHPLLAAVLLFGDQPGLLQYRHVFLHGGEAERVAAGQRRHRVVAGHGLGQDVATGAIGQCVEQPVDVLVVEFHRQVQNLQPFSCRLCAGSWLVKKFDSYDRSRRPFICFRMSVDA